MKAGNSLNVGFSGRRFLVVDDIEVNREIAAELLRDAGAQVEFAEGGQRCVEMVSSAPAGHYDLILIDISMPVMTGLEAARRLRQMGVALPIVAMTANAGDQYRHAALDAGMDTFVEKPIRLEKLFLEIARCLGG